ncbi:MAG: nicotinate phosphoribosyltransferase [Candidatus Omnitrophica bacterium]|nr:nicotinate phosphoribosyltransferase [Candidatus Omnitrophota bacterium]
MSKSLIIDLYELTMAQVYFKYKSESLAGFDLFIRSAKRPFYVACGIDESLSYISDLRFKKEDIDYLKSLALFEPEFLKYLKSFRFKGEVWGVGEPEIVFAGEPILSVRGSLIESQIVESALLNKINLATTLATKAARVVFAASGRGVYDFSLRRTQGSAAALKVAEYSYIAGARGTSNVHAGFVYGIPVAGTMAHSFVMSFERELDSFMAFSQQFPAKSILLVDTYNLKQGIASAVKVAKFIEKKGFSLLGIRLDSGNLAKDAFLARRMLDSAGLVDTQIFASGDLDEYKITDLVSQKVPIDAFGVGTNMGCSSDAPFTNVIYKLVEVKNRQGKFMPTMKLSQGKITLPGKKQVFRTIDKKGLMIKDVIALEGEKLKGRKLLKKLMSNGQKIYKKNSLNEKRNIFSAKFAEIPETFRKPDCLQTFPVDISRKLNALTETLKDEISMRFSPRVIFIDIDTQYGFLKKGSNLYVPKTETLLDNIKALTRLAQEKKILVISSQDTHCSGDPEFKRFPVHCLKGSLEHKKIKESLLGKRVVVPTDKIFHFSWLSSLVEKNDQIIIEKHIFSIFSNPNMSSLLEIIFPDTIFLYGLVTEYCGGYFKTGLCGYSGYGCG